jgi:CheY-like chemotaxis protein
VGASRDVVAVERASERERERARRATNIGRYAPVRTCYAAVWFVRHTPRIEKLPLKVLIVEDNPMARVALERILARRGLCVESAGTLRRGRELLDGQAVLILDLDLPDGSGAELLRQVRQENRRIKVIVVTGSDDPALLSDVRSLNPDALFHKPLDLRAMLEHLDPPR